MTLDLRTNPNGEPYVVTTIDGLEIAWAFCGGCDQHIVNCTHDMPITPLYIARWVDEFENGAVPTYNPGATSQTIVGSVSASGNRREPSQRAAEQPKAIDVNSLIDDDVIAAAKAARKE
jgi:hypothetical protein